MSPRKTHRRSLPTAFLVLLLSGLLAPTAQAQPQPVRLRITLQPDCYRPSLAAACDRRKTKIGEGEARLDLGPQIAVWVEQADGKFVDTVMVTNLTALLGIGNRPGHVTLPSAPKFPYGRRTMVLPVWAHKRGTFYDSVVMNDGVEREYWLGFHEVASSPDPYFCRPVTFDEIDVDAVSCPTQQFNSVKGRFFNPARELSPEHTVNGSPAAYVPPPKTPYPPRNDLVTFTHHDCDSGQGPNCPVSAKKFAEINDLDGVAAATPPYGRAFSKLWRVPDGMAEGDYALFVEVSKEFDNNASHAYPARKDEMLIGWGLLNNFGQPSVVWKVPFTLSRSKPVAAAATMIAGYGDPTGASGQLRAPDSTISDAPGSGAGRLLAINVPAPSASGVTSLTGRVVVTTEIEGDPGSLPPAPPPDAGPEPDAGEGDAGAPVDAPAPSPCLVSEAPPLEITVEQVDAEQAQVSFVEPSGALWAAIDDYEVKRWNGSANSEAAFVSGFPLLSVPRNAPGSRVSVPVPNLKSRLTYTVGARFGGACGKGPVGYGNFTTKVREFTMLSGCFVATAAFGSPLARDVDLLRRVRDRAAGGNGVAAAAAAVYGRSSPPVANLIAGSEAARAVARRLLAPLVEVARVVDRAGK